MKVKYHIYLRRDELWLGIGFQMMARELIMQVFHSIVDFIESILSFG